MHRKHGGRRPSSPSCHPTPPGLTAVPACCFLHSPHLVTPPGLASWPPGFPPCPGILPGPSTLHILEQPQSVCSSEPVAASPRSPASSDASRRSSRFTTCLKQVLCRTGWAQADARMALGCSRTTDALGQHLSYPCPPTEAKTVRPQPPCDPYEADVNCALSAVGWGGEARPDKRAPCQQMGSRVIHTLRWNRLGN